MSLFEMNQRRFSEMERPVELDIVAAIIDYESGELSEEMTLMLFSELIRTGLAWTLQGSYGRVAIAFIKEGLISETGEVL